MRGTFKPLLTLLACSACLGALASPASAAQVRIVDSGQRDILDRGLLVRVSADHGGFVWLRGGSRSFDRPWLSNLTYPRLIHVRRGHRLVNLPLTWRGRKQIRSCQPRTLLVQSWSWRLFRGQRDHDSAALARDRAKCRPQPVDLSRADHCNFIGEQQDSLCLLPFPDDFHTVRDPGLATGRRINLQNESTEPNSAGARVETAPYNRNDGFSPGQTIVVKVPGLNSVAAMQRTGAVPLSHIGEYRRKRAPVVVIDAKTGKRWPIWAEIDSNAGDPDRVALLIHPARNFKPKHRYVVALRKLRTADGERIPAPAGFRYYRDELPSRSPAINRQRGRFESVFRSLRRARIKRANLYLAWDFTVSSSLNIAERMLHIRDDAFAQLGDTDLSDLAVQGGSPAFSVTGTQNFTPAQDPNIARAVSGTFTVPCYLQPDCAPGGAFELGADGLPTRNGDWTANFQCIIPRKAVDGASVPSRPSLYGHGLLGSANEVNSSPQRTLSQFANITHCATDEIGFSSADVPTAITILGDLSNFPKLSDRVQQGLLNELFLGRLMIHPDGFLSHGAFHADGTTASPGVIDPSRLYYNGNSQGGILGGALTAVAPDFTRASLGVPAMNYSVLLNRSVDFDTFQLVLNPAYPDKLTQQLGLSLIQMLWDRSDPNGYVHRMTDHPLPDTPPHEVLLNVAFGDHQVTSWQADVEARTIGASAHAPVVDPGRWPGVDQLWGIPRIRSYPFRDSAIVYWDSGPARPDPANPLATIGTDPPPLTNTPNRSGEDPHGDPRAALAEQTMVSQFLRPNASSMITDTCLGGPCYAGTWTGP